MQSKYIPCRVVFTTRLAPILLASDTHRLKLECWSYDAVESKVPYIGIDVSKLMFAS